MLGNPVWNLLRLLILMTLVPCKVVAAGEDSQTNCIDHEVAEQFNVLSQGLRREASALLKVYLHRWFSYPGVVDFFEDFLPTISTTEALRGNARGQVQKMFLWMGWLVEEDCMGILQTVFEEMQTPKTNELATQVESFLHLFVTNPQLHVTKEDHTIENPVQLKTAVHKWINSGRHKKKIARDLRRLGDMGEKRPNFAILGFRALADEILGRDLLTGGSSLAEIISILNHICSSFSDANVFTRVRKQATRLENVLFKAKSESTTRESIRFQLLSQRSALEIHYLVKQAKRLCIKGKIEYTTRKLRELRLYTQLLSDAEFLGLLALEARQLGTNEALEIAADVSQLLRLQGSQRGAAGNTAAHIDFLTGAAGYQLPGGNCENIIDGEDRRSS